MSLDRIVEFACREGDLRHLRLVLSMNASYDYGFADPCAVAAAYGNVTVLALLRSYDIPWGAAFVSAILRQQMHVVEWMLKQGFHKDERAPIDSQSTSLRASLAFRRESLRSS